MSVIMVITIIVGNSLPDAMRTEPHRTPQSTQGSSTSSSIVKHGFPVDIVVGNFDPKYKCGYCEWLLRDPIQNSCGHRFCKLCLEDLKK